MIPGVNQIFRRRKSSIHEDVERQLEVEKRKEQRPKSLPFVICLTALCILFLLRSYLYWAWQNRFYFVGCPEQAVWLRRPFSGWRVDQHTPPRVLHLTAKFGRRNNEFERQLSEHRDKLLRMQVLNDSEIVHYGSFPFFIFNDPTWKDHLAYLSDDTKSQRGGGYWFWKPVLMQHHLSQLHEGDFLIYSDADVVDHLSWTPLLLESMVDGHFNLGIYEQEYPEREWNKRDVYKYMCPHMEIAQDQSLQYSAMWLVVRKSKGTMQFLQRWVDAAKDFHHLNDEPSAISNIPEYQEHRHDQSLLSLLLKCGYGEPGKQRFRYTCLGNWNLQLFRVPKVEQ